MTALPSFSKNAERHTDQPSKPERPAIIYAPQIRSPQALLKHANSMLTIPCPPYPLTAVSQDQTHHLSSHNSGSLKPPGTCF